MNDGNAMRRRLLKYILPVFLLSLAFTVPKFFEAQIAYRDISEITAAGENVTRVSKSREDDMRIEIGKCRSCTRSFGADE